MLYLISWTFRWKYLFIFVFRTFVFGKWLPPKHRYRFIGKLFVYYCLRQLHDHRRKWYSIVLIVAASTTQACRLIRIGSVCWCETCLCNMCFDAKSQFQIRIASHEELKTFGFIYVKQMRYLFNDKHGNSLILFYSPVFCSRNFRTDWSNMMRQWKEFLRSN